MLQQQLRDVWALVIGREDQGRVSALILLIDTDLLVDQRLGQLHIVGSGCEVEILRLRPHDRCQSNHRDDDCNQSGFHCETLLWLDSYLVLDTRLVAVLAASPARSALITEILPNMTAYIMLVTPLESEAVAFAPLSSSNLTSRSFPLKEAPIKAVLPEWSLISVFAPSFRRSCATSKLSL